MHRYVLVAALAAAACGKKHDGPAAAGPAPAWRSPIDPDLYEAIAAAPDTLITVAEHGLTAYRDGAVAWTRELPAEARGVLVELDPATVLATDDAGNLHAIAVADGAIKWTAQTPPPGEDTVGAGDHPALTKVAVAGKTVIGLDAMNRFIKIDPAACAAKAEACMTPSGGMSWEVDVEGFTIDSGGGRAVWTFTSAALFDGNGERIGGFRTGDVIAGVAASEHGYLIGYDKGLVEVHPEHCKMDDDDRVQLDDDAALAAAPKGCLERLHTGAVDSPPVGTGFGAVWVSDQELYGHGRTDWHISAERVHVASGVTAVGTVAYVACWQEPTGDDLFVSIADLCTIDLASGHLVRRSKLGLQRAGMLDSPWLVANDKMAFVVVKNQLVAVATR